MTSEQAENRSQVQDQAQREEQVLHIVVDGVMIYVTAN